MKKLIIDYIAVRKVDIKVVYLLLNIVIFLFWLVRVSSYCLGFLVDLVEFFFESF